MNESNYETVEKRVLGSLGFLILAISIIFSYDGFDQSMSGGNAGYSFAGKAIAIVLAVTFSAVQFILNSRPDKLNPTLVLLGLVAYAYSIYTNYLGAEHLLGMSKEMALAVAFGLDVAPEPMIAWAFGDPKRGDLVGNFMGLAKSWLTGKPVRLLGGSSGSQSNPQSSSQPRPAIHNFSGNGKSGGFPSGDTQPKFNPNQGNPDRVRPDFAKKLGKGR